MIRTLFTVGRRWQQEWRNEIQIGSILLLVHGAFVHAGVPRADVTGRIDVNDRHHGVQNLGSALAQLIAALIPAGTVEIEPINEDSLLQMAKNYRRESGKIRIHDVRKLKCKNL